MQNKKNKKQKTTKIHLVHCVSFDLNYEQSIIGDSMQKSFPQCTVIMVLPISRVGSSPSPLFPDFVFLPNRLCKGSVSGEASSES